MPTRVRNALAGRPAALLKEILQIINELLPLGGYLDGAVQLAQQLLLLPGQMGGGLHHHGEALVAPAAGIAHLGNALLPEDELPPLPERRS